MPRLHAGDVAPSFRTTDLFGNPVDLDALRGSFVFLSFLRNAACAICNLRVPELITHDTELANAGIAIVTVFESAADAMRRHVGRQDAPFPIVADPDARLYDLY